jgi:hypothetical protein
MLRRARCRLLAGIAALGALGFTAPPEADPVFPPWSSKQVTPGNTFVFVMISPLPVEDEVRPWGEGAMADIREVRRTYTRTGMYRNDGSTEPLWTVDWYAHDVELIPDGVHLIRHGPWAGLRGDGTPDLDQEALSFFANGRLLRTYRIGELVDDPARLPRSASHFLWQNGSRGRGEFEYTIVTFDGNRFVFDVRSGEIVSEARADSTIGRGWWVVVGVVVGLVSWGVWRRRVGWRPTQRKLFLALVLLLVVGGLVAWLWPSDPDDSFCTELLPLPSERQSRDLARDRELMWQTENGRSTEEAIRAADRVFGTVQLLGLSRAEVIAMLGDPRTTGTRQHSTPWYPAGWRDLVYRFDNGAYGQQFNVRFDWRGKVRRVQSLGIE